MIEIVKKIVENHNAAVVYEFTDQDICDFCNEFSVGGWFTEYYVEDKKIMQRNMLTGDCIEFNYSDLFDWAEAALEITVDPGKTTKEDLELIGYTPKMFQRSLIEALIERCVLQLYKTSIHKFADQSPNEREYWCNYAFESYQK